MGNNFFVPFATARFRASEMNTPLIALDKAISYQQNVMVHCDGDLSYDKATGILSWSATLRILFNRADGQAIQNTVAAGSVTLTDNKFAYVTLNETNDTVLTVSSATVSTAAASNFLALGRLVLAYRNTTSDECYAVGITHPIRKIEAHIADAVTVHTITDPTDAPVDADALREDLVTNVVPSVESALNALGVKVNAIIAVLEARKQTASS
jgi:hypothetical protein